MEKPKGHLVASASSKVLIHRIDDSVPAALINDPHRGFEVSAVTWSHNNMILATCGTNSNSITLARTSDGTVIQEMELCPRGISITDLCFSSNSVFIAFGCDDASIGIVNVRSKKLEAMIREHDSAYTVRAVAFNCYDTLLASGASDGELVVYSLTTDSSTQEQRSERIFRDMQVRSPLIMARFSFTKRHVMASCYQNGVVCIWDLL
mmetsp:Transcript_11876/g.15119  ORF Transcript_11876/g.15119 Transcript_11876/m.15119 type:complete len:207 (-) Transcript_11876:1530-2150(-)